MDILKYVIGVDEAAEILGLKAGTVKNKCALGELPAKKIGNTWVLDKIKLLEGMQVRKELWKTYDFVYLVNASDIKEGIYLGENIIFHNIDFLDIDVVNRRYKEYAEENDISGNLDDLETFFEDVFGIVKVDADYGDELYTDDVNKLVFDVENQEFFYTDDGLNVSYFEWWDGHNWQRVIDHELEVEYRVSLLLNNNSVSLDEWDGSNFQTGGVGYHERVYRILEIDGEKVEDQFLLEKTSQWQGEHATGEILTLDDVEEHLKDLGRNVDEYMEDIKNLIK